MNTKPVLGQRPIEFTLYMQKHRFLQEAGLPYSALERCISDGDVELHLIDGRVQINILEALRAIAAKWPSRYGHRLTRIANEFEAVLPEAQKVDLFA